MSLILVTGGCGFIGSHLVTALLKRGDRVRVLDDLSTGQLNNLAPGAAFVQGDIADAGTVAKAMEGASACVHLAAIASVERGVKEWLATHRANLSGSIAVFDAARTAGGMPVVYASSAAVYGDQALLPIAEDAPKLPLSAYGADKLGCEQHAKVAGHVHGVPTLGLRFFNVFGRRQDPASPYSGVISIFCNRLARGEAVSIFGDGGQTRDFVHVSDVVAALLAALPAASTAAPVLNVCTGQAISVTALAETVASLSGPAARGLQPRYLPARSGEIRHSVGDPSRARAMLGLGEPRGLADGLADVLDWINAGQPGLVA
jgi:UDP-glucose 4-epimerase